MLGLLLGLIVAAVSLPASANYYEFTGTLSIPEGSMRFLPRGKSVSGSGIGFSSGSEIRLSVVNGFTGTLQTFFGSTGGYTQQAFITAVGDGDFSKPSELDGLHGKMAVGGLARRRFSGGAYAAFPLTQNEMTGLGLGGALLAQSGATPAAQFATWTTGDVMVPSVILESHPAMGTHSTGAISEMGYDLRTPLGMGQVQFVTPIRTVAGVPANRAAFAELTLTFVPEPGRAVLLIGGSAAVALLGARCARRAGER